MPKARRFLSKPAKRSKHSKSAKKYHQLKRLSNNSAEHALMSTHSISNSNGQMEKSAASTSNFIPEELDAAESESSLSDLCIEKDLSPPKDIDELLSGRRIVNLRYVLRQYRNVVLHSLKCTTGKMQFAKETRRGLFSTLHFHCDNCNKEMLISTDPSEKTEINESFVWGTLSVGIGHSQSEELLSLIDIPSMTAKTYVTYTGYVKKHWESHLVEKMRKAGEEEKEIAINKGHLTSEGLPYITVIGDGGWSKRSYGHGYSVTSGVGIIIGAATKKPLYISVRNKVCSMCSYYKIKNEEPKPHECFLNYTGPSTGMEKDIITEGFCRSIEQHGLIYKYYIDCCDGDSSVYTSIVEKVPYGRQVVKIECANHMTRCISDKLHKLSKNTSYPLYARRLLSEKSEGISRIERLVKGVRVAIKTVAKNYEVEKLRAMVSNAPYHVFGRHTKCSESFCTRKENHEEDLIPQLESSKIEELKKILDPLILKADRVAFNETTNSAERYMSMVSKFTGGKRVNFTKRSSYMTRAYGAALSHIAGPSWHMSPHIKIHKHTAGNVFKKVMERKRIVSCKRKLKFSTEPSKKRRIPSQGPDKDYGLQSADPDMTAAQLENNKLSFLQEKLAKRVSSKEDQIKIEQSTRGQHENALWREIRKDCLTASNFGCVIKQRTHCHNLVKRLLYSRELTTLPILYGRNNETAAIAKYEAAKGVKVERCGIFLDINYPFLGASPDGLISTNGLVEVKCLPSLSGKLLKDVTGKTTCFKIVDGRPCLKTNHNYYFQIQGQLNITGREYCDFVIYTDDDFSIERILKDSVLWENEMLPKLKAFYLNCILPEIIDGRLPRGLKIRDPDNDTDSLTPIPDSN